jgi:hypothetical protein
VLVRSFIFGCTAVHAAWLNLLPDQQLCCCWQYILVAVDGELGCEAVYRFSSLQTQVCMLLHRLVTQCASRSATPSASRLSTGYSTSVRRVNWISHSFIMVSSAGTACSVDGALELHCRVLKILRGLVQVCNMPCVL